MGGWRCGYLRRSREGSDYTTINLYFVSHVFQSTLPRRERRDIPTPKVTPRHEISIHAPAKGATSCRPAGRRSVFYFNPRSREGSDVLVAVLDRTHVISIHAPAKGATVSQLVAAFSLRLFQSTLPRRERPCLRSMSASRSTISIHAPAKGATSPPAPSSRYGIPFQSTLPRRERPQAGAADGVQLRHFNPRSREGSDIMPQPVHIPAFRISIHAPAKGATAKITKTIPNDFCKINNYNNSFA